MQFIPVINLDGTNGSAKLPRDIKNYLIDIDGTICEDISNEEPERMPGAKELTGAKDKINALYDSRHIITFFTSRLESHRTVTEKWLEDHGFKYHKMIMEKPRGGNYIWIDDREIEAIKFNNWNNI